MPYRCSEQDGYIESIGSWRLRLGKTTNNMDVSFPPSFDRYRGNLRWC
jgi:hypothetical protein